MSYNFFQDILAELHYKLNYDAVVNYAGNSFCQKSWDMISESNPFNISQDGKKKNTKVMDTLADFFNKADITIKKKDKGDK